jgi:hypothetical protein
MLALIAQFGRFRTVRKARRDEKKTMARRMHDCANGFMTDGARSVAEEGLRDFKKQSAKLEPLFCNIKVYNCLICAKRCLNRLSFQVKNEWNMKIGLGSHSETFLYSRKTITGHKGK